MRRNPAPETEERMNKAVRNHIALALMLALSLCLIGCGDKDGQKAAAKLPDLPQDRIATLKHIPKSQAIATTTVKRVSGPPPVPSPPPQCPQNAGEEDFDALVTYPITVCEPISIDLTDVAVLFIEGRGPTHKVANSQLPPDLQVKGANQSAAVIESSFLWRCRTDEGPWRGFLTSERQCIFSCAPLNTLELDNTPGLVVFQWYGDILNDHPSDFEFDGKPVLLGKSDHGDCHNP
jgi:hypothetical protein